MHSKGGKTTSPRGRRGPGTRSPEDRARDRAINKAIANAGSQPGPIIVRLGEKPKTKAPKEARKRERGSAKPKGKDSAPLSNSAIADALLAAGVTIGPSSKVSSAGAAQRSSSKKSAKGRVGDQPKAKQAKVKGANPSAAKKKSKRARDPSFGADAHKERRAQLENRRRKFLKALKDKAEKAGPPARKPAVRWRVRMEEVARFIAEIESAPFSTLLQQWKRHVVLAEYIIRTGVNEDRLDDYQELIGAIESEWKRRSNLKFTSDEYFDWPTTDAAKGNGKLGEIDWAAEGALAYLGYHVGEGSSLRMGERQALLRRFFSMHIPPIESPTYVRSWGAPSSEARLKKMADSLASFVRTAKRRSMNLNVAISEWETDLEMLHDEFYVAKFGFGWPKI